MALLGRSDDYTDVDFDALLARLRNLISSVYPDWVDAQVADLDNLIVEALCHVGDVLGKYQNAQALEAFWENVTQRRNMLAHCKQIGFTPRGNTASVVDVELRLAALPAARVIIPARTPVRTESIVEPVVFETLEEVVFETGKQGPVLVSAENAQLREEFFTVTSLPNQELVLLGTPYLDGSLKVKSALGDFSVVENFLGSTAESLHCTVTVDQDDRATVRFGNGASGAIPSGVLTVEYKVGGGSGGRVEANKVRKVDVSFTDANGTPAILLANNPEASSQALDRMSIEEIRRLAPLTLDATERSVSDSDFEIHAQKVPGVSRVIFLNSARYEGIEENTGTLYIIPTGGGVPTLALREAVKKMVTVDYPCQSTFQVSVQGASYKSLSVYAIISLAAGADKARVRALIQVALEGDFAIEKADGTPNPKVDFGYNLRDTEAGEASGSIAWSSIFNTLVDVQGVKKLRAGGDSLLLGGKAEDFELHPFEFPVLGEVEIIDAATGTPIPLDVELYNELRVEDV